jgi:hypothetical protein
LDPPFNIEGKILALLFFMKVLKIFYPSCPLNLSLLPQAAPYSCDLFPDLFTELYECDNDLDLSNVWMFSFMTFCDVEDSTGLYGSYRLLFGTCQDLAQGRNLQVGKYLANIAIFKNYIFL